MTVQQKINLLHQIKTRIEECNIPQEVIYAMIDHPKFKTFLDGKSIMFVDENRLVVDFFPISAK